MESWRLYHNPRCSKSRSALELLRSRGIEPIVIEYLKTPPTVAELTELVALLGASPRDIVRSKEDAFRELALAEKPETEWLSAVASHPVLLERPIVVRGKRAVIGRPPERVFELLD